MKDALAPFFQEIADALLVGDFEALVNRCSYPLAIYVNGELVIEKTPEDSMTAIKARRDKVLQTGVSSILTKITKVGEEPDGRFSVWINWVFLNADGQALGSNQLRYFCLTSECGETKIQLIEFLEPWFGMSPTTEPVKFH